jgi:hypothetical protein
VFPQSARTRCVKPVKSTELRTHHAKWNEHFIFEVPEQVIFNVVVSVQYLNFLFDGSFFLDLSCNNPWTDLSVN